MSRELQRDGHRLAFETMGTVVSVVAGAGSRLDEATCAAVRATFDALDDRFSLHKPSSEATAVARGTLAVEHASEEFRRAHALASRWEQETRGAFTATAPDGHLDLSGVVKAMAIEAAGAALDAAGVADWAIGCGGDVLVRGREGGPATAGRPGPTPWVVGIVDPADRTRLASQHTATAALPAVATSGSAERGEHIWRTDARATYTQVTVAGPDIVTADALATAIVAGGPDTFGLVTARHRVEVLAWRADGTPQATRGFLAWPAALASQRR